MGSKDIRLCVYESISDFVANPNLRGWVAADEVEDTKALHEENRKLREENAALSERLRKMEVAAETRAKSLPDSNKELLDVLDAIEIKIPANLAGGKESTSTLLSIAYGNRDTLINGITNRFDASDAETFYYYNILPKLQAHGLADNEKVPGARYRRSFLNKAGQALFAEVEKQVLRSKVKPTEAATQAGNGQNASVKEGEGKAEAIRKSPPPQKARGRAKKPE
jgi:hypothetical protein